MAKMKLDADAIVEFFLEHAVVVENEETGEKVETLFKLGTDGKNTAEVVCTLADLMAGNKAAGDSVVEEMRRRGGGSGDSSSGGAVARHFLLARREGGFAILDSRDSGNKGTEKRAARAGLSLTARRLWPELDTILVSLVETPSGVSVYGVETAEDFLDILGAVSAPEGA